METNFFKTEPKPLQPIHGGKIVIVGVKASNIEEELRNHPQIVMWDSQNESWSSKELPVNTRAVFFTRFIGHDTFTKIQKEARKRHITLFNPIGTGMIVKQIKELLNLTHKEFSDMEPINALASSKTTFSPEEPKPMAPKVGGVSKLHVLHPFVDFSKGPMDNARALMEKAKELNVNTSIISLAQMVSQLRKKRGLSAPPKSRRKAQATVKTGKTVEKDVSIQMFDDLIKQMTDMRDFLVATVAENTRLRAKVDKFKKFFDE